MGEQAQDNASLHWLASIVPGEFSWVVSQLRGWKVFIHSGASSKLPLSLLLPCPSPCFPFCPGWLIPLWCRDTALCHSAHCGVMKALNCQCCCFLLFQASPILHCFASAQTRGVSLHPSSALLSLLRIRVLILPPWASFSLTAATHDSFDPHLFLDNKRSLVLNSCYFCWVTFNAVLSYPWNSVRVLFVIPANSTINTV